MLQHEALEEAEGEEKQGGRGGGGGGHGELILLPASTPQAALPGGISHLGGKGSLH